MRAHLIAKITSRVLTFLVLKCAPASALCMVAVATLTVPAPVITVISGMTVDKNYVLVAVIMATAIHLLASAHVMLTTRVYAVTCGLPLARRIVMGEVCVTTLLEYARAFLLHLEMHVNGQNVLDHA